MSKIWTPGAVPSRRDFLRTSSVAVAGATALGALSARAADEKPLPKPHVGGGDLIRIGLIGCGGRGTGAANQALQADPNVKLVAVGDAFQDRLDSALKSIEKLGASKVDVPQERRFVGFDAYKQVLTSGVDLVILATPPGFRPIHFSAAVAAGKHVFMEKPVAVDAPGVRMVIDSARQAKEKGLAVGVGLQRRHQLTYLETIKRIHDGAIGDVVSQRVYWNGAGVWVKKRADLVKAKPDLTEMEYQMRNWYYFNWLCGDHICEQHIHNLDVGCWVKNGWPIKAEGMGGRQVRTGEDYGEIYDHHAVEYEFEDGSRMFSYCRHIPKCWDSVTEHAQGTKGVADVSAASIKTGEDQWRYRGEKNNPYQTEHDDLIASIRSGAPINEGERGALSSMVAVLGRMCTYSGQMIKWEDALNSNISLAPSEYSWSAEPPKAAVAVPGVTQVLKA
ncbi:MAG: Gfo/Idh/MocA family oxidoreductase [Planctomycetes bacterium]|nr:Gfo/Idh/MocA family oxidoreductase [Planctomycetota bacterium]